MGKKNNGTENFGHPSLDQTNRFPIDRLLRDNGFVLWERKGKDESVWRRGKEKFSQKEALALIDKSKVQDAEYMEELGRTEDITVG